MDSRLLIKRITDWSEYTHRFNFSKSWLENGFETATDGYRIVRLYQPINNNLEIKENEISKFYQPINDENEEYIKVVLPNISEFKSRMNNVIGRRYKSERCCYRIGDNENLAIVNAKFLCDLMEILETNEIYYNKTKPTTTPLLLKSDKGDALLMPIWNQYRNDVGFWKM